MIWAKKTLGDIYEIEGGNVQTGPFGSQLHESDYVDNGIPVIMPKDIVNDKLNFSSTAKIKKEDANRLKKHIVEIDDIVFPRRGEIDKRILIDEFSEGAFCGTGCIRLRGNGSVLFPKYLFYYSKQVSVVKWIENQAIGATMMNLNTSILKSVPIYYPDDIKLQQKITSILSAYDDLIENNNQRIQLLEEMASEIYKEWFVRLRFPGYENAVFRDKNGKKVDRESDGALPDRWKKEQLREHINFYRGKSYSSAELRDNEGLAMINLKNIQRQGGFRLDGLKYFEGKYNLNNEAYSGDIVMAVTDMTQEREIVGRVALVPDMGIEKFIISMDLIRIEPVALPKLYLYCFFRYSGIGLQLKEFANGANVLHLTPSLIEFQKAVIPHAAICEKFEELIKPMLSEIDVLNNKNQVLQETRDLLLPRLISGKLSVEHLLNETYEPKEAVRTAAEPAAVYETKSIK